MTHTSIRHHDKFAVALAEVFELHIDTYYIHSYG